MNKKRTKQELKKEEKKIHEVIELVTETNKTQLNDKQLQAIDLILIGNTDDWVAKYVGVNRSTVNQWKNHNPYFKAELNRRRKEVWGATLDRIRHLAFKALDTAEVAIEQGDKKFTLEFIKMLGLNKQDLSNIEEDNAEEIIMKEKEKDNWDKLLGSFVK